MTEHEPQSEQEFEHFHEHYVRDIADVVSAVREASGTPTQGRVADMFESFFGADAAKFIAADAKPEPDTVLKKAMSKLGDAHRLELVVSNLLEGVKRGDKLEDLVKNLTTLGLMSEDSNLRSSKRQARSGNAKPDGDFLEKTVGWARRIGVALWRIGVNAIRTIPRFAKLSPKARFGFVGPIPSFHLEFEIEPHGLTFHELGELLFRGVGAPAK